LSIDFPELVGPGIVQLKRYIKKSTNVNFNKQIHGLIEKVSSMFGGRCQDPGT
jgi:nucleolar complex protein 2